ncbi:Xaa-His dipeptidase [Mesocricetibacter intestinalis]|uniref:Cytosol non-specific dipeptidase n=1 Tax=Mesocricetibacter intestinalis TaxID=1521930 RepID=A0A4R6VFW3_9PAST|nr:aminoacyl-histidine dipeptidase [Mesocricetibacter intestinalis]TDQ56394.1 Xaa-His dipeptidase [Mesocricetibacter intestinalis]
MSEIQSLAPRLLWKWFDQVCSIPHPSYYEDKLADFIAHWAKTKGFYAERDEAGNLLIRKAASKGMENRPGVALQAHLDMVPQANEDTRHDFKTDPIRPYIDGEWVSAEGTTLGADNGIGLASALAVLDSEDLAHPPLEVLLTMTEEAGMEGAIGLRPNWLQSEIMINTDTEENGEIYIGCAGGENADLSIALQWQPNSFQHSFQLILKGLRGGHSGVDIHTGRANAIKLLARFAADFQQKHPQFEFSLAEIRGGSVRNAIPREAFATFCFNADPLILQTAVENFRHSVAHELAHAEPNLSISLQPVSKPEKVFTGEKAMGIIHLFNALPNGVIRNSDTVPGVVETSLSVGVLKTEAEQVRATILLRSLLSSGTEYTETLLSSIATLAGAKVSFSGKYPGWEPHQDTRILNLTREVYAEILGQEPKIKVIHAGLECGLLKKIYPQMDIVSIGPTIVNAHSPDEKVHIPAVQTYWRLLTGILARMPAKTA